MVWWKRKKKSKKDPQTVEFIEKLMGPLVLSGAVTSAVADYVKGVESGENFYPAPRSENSSILSLWKALRLEVFHKMFNFGKSSPTLLADYSAQSKLAKMFVEERPYLEFPQPRDEEYADSIQAVWQAYIYLGDIGTELGDDKTDRFSLKLRDETIFSNLENKMQQLHEILESGLEHYESDKSGIEIPKTFFEIVFDDITAKCKSVAFSKYFGPLHEAGIQRLEQMIEERGGDGSEVRKSLKALLDAKDPDEVLSAQSS